MSLSDEQKHKINSLIDAKDQIVYSLNHIEHILKTYFPEEYERAIQFYIPQITTALNDDKKWLNRGEYSFQNTIDNLLERCKMSTEYENLKRFI